MNFHCMLKYGVWTDPYERNVTKISEAFNATQRPGSDKKSQFSFYKLLLQYPEKRGDGTEQFHIK